MSYADETGNLRLALDAPALFVESLGADRDPDTTPRPLKSLRGAAAGRVVRAVCDFDAPFGIRQLAEQANVPVSSVSRVISFLEEEALLTRDGTKQVVTVNRPSLIQRWAHDYDVRTANLAQLYIEPLGLSALLEKLPRLERYAVTGPLASATTAPARIAMVYVESPDEAAELLELTPTDIGANVWLLSPFDPVVFERSQPKQIMGTSSPVNVVAQSQLAADLLTSPGRAPQEGHAILEAMHAPTRRSEPST